MIFEGESPSICESLSCVEQYTISNGISNICFYWENGDACRLDQCQALLKAATHCPKANGLSHIVYMCSMSYLVLTCMHVVLGEFEIRQARGNPQERTVIKRAWLMFGVSFKVKVEIQSVKQRQDTPG